MSPEHFILQHPETLDYVRGFSSVTEAVWTSDSRQARLFDEVAVMEVAEDLYRTTGITFNVIDTEEEKI